MNTANQTNETPLQDFSNCHAGIFSKLSVLDGLPALVDAAAKARSGAQDVLSFFHSAMFEHHEEEERELFPAVLAAATVGEERTRVAEMAQALTREHRELEALWKQLEPALKRVAKGLDADVPMTALSEMVQKYGAHARNEETGYLPLAHTILSRRGDQMEALALALHIRHRPQVIGYV